MANQPLSPSQIAKLGEVFMARLRKHPPSAQQAQELIEEKWSIFAEELGRAIDEAITRVLSRLRKIVKLTVVREFPVPERFMLHIVEVDPVPVVHFGLVTYALEPCIEGSGEVTGKVFLEKVDVQNSGNLQDALQFLEFQFSIPSDLAERRIVFPGTVAMDSDGRRYIATVTAGPRRKFDWYLLDRPIKDDMLFPRVIKIEDEQTS